MTVYDQLPIHASYVKQATDSLNKKIEEARKAGLDVKLKVKPLNEKGFIETEYNKLPSVSITGIEVETYYEVK